MVLFHTWILVPQEIYTTSKLKIRNMFWLCELTVTDFELVVLRFHMWEFLCSNLSLETCYPVTGICGFYHLCQQVSI